MIKLRYGKFYRNGLEPKPLKVSDTKLTSLLYFDDTSADASIFQPLQFAALRRRTIKDLAT